MNVIRKSTFTARAAALVIAALAVVALTSTAAAGPAGEVKTFTGCLASGDGVILKVKQGDTPKSACSSGQTLARLSGGDITRIAVSGALTLPDGPNTGESGDVTIGLKPEFTLPPGCDDGEIAEWDTAPSPDRWTCGVDDDTPYSASTGLDLSSSNAFNIEPGYRVKNTPDCSSGQFATGFDSDGDVECEAPATPAGLRAHFASVGEVTVGGPTTIISKTLPAGMYALFATVEIDNKDADSPSSMDYCSIPGYSTTESIQVPDGVSELISLVSAVSHPGGAVVLTCDEFVADVDVASATLLALEVGSIG